MSKFFEMHAENPQLRLLKQAAEIIEQGGVIAYPTDSAYALGCHTGDKEAMNRIRKIRDLNKHHNFTLVCRDLSDLAIYAKVENNVFRMLKALTPGPYTFILPATSEVPKRVLHPKRKTIGLRIPDNAIVNGLLNELNIPLLSVTLHLPGDEFPIIDPYEIKDRLGHCVDLVIDGGYCGAESTSVIDCTGSGLEVIREGKGDVSLFL
jgi:tRNA threonylcarbamoyl adenosine modification protein (Sua5/YciO/YrdC/YwlC family)